MSNLVWLASIIIFFAVVAWMASWQTWAACILPMLLAFRNYTGSFFRSQLWTHFLCIHLAQNLNTPVQTQRWGRVNGLYFRSGLQASNSKQPKRWTLLKSIEECKHSYQWIPQQRSSARLVQNHTLFPDPLHIWDFANWFSTNNYHKHVALKSDHKKRTN